MLKSKKIVDWLYNYSLYFIIGALLLVIIAIEPSFVRVSNFTTILTQSATKIIYACGIAGIIVLGGTDLALGREVGLAAVVAASLLQAVDYSQRVFSADQVPALPLIVPLLLVMVLLGIICAAHGFIVAHWGVAPFVASLGVQLISYGLCLQYFNTVCNSNPLSGFTKTYSKFCQGTIRIGNISLSYLMFYAIAVVAVMWVIWNRTTLGKNMFAIGGNREAAKVCGVNVKLSTASRMMVSCSSSDTPANGALSNMRIQSARPSSVCWGVGRSNSSAARTCKPWRSSMGAYSPTVGK